MRKEIVVTLKDRERPLTFKIREMPATRLESWLTRALLLIAKGSAGSDAGGGIDALAKLDAGGLVKTLAAAAGKIEYAEAKPLLDEMLACCSRVDAGIEQICTPETVDGYVEDVRTLFRLRVEAVKLHLGFFMEDAPSPSPAEAAETARETPPKARSSVIRTSAR